MTVPGLVVINKVRLETPTCERILQAIVAMLRGLVLFVARLLLRSACYYFVYTYCCTVPGPRYLLQVV